jgi:hypothetical protein
MFGIEKDFNIAYLSKNDSFTIRRQKSFCIEIEGEKFFSCLPNKTKEKIIKKIINKYKNIILLNRILEFIKTRLKFYFVKVEMIDGNDFLYLKYNIDYLIKNKTAFIKIIDNFFKLPNEYGVFVFNYKKYSNEIYIRKDNIYKILTEITTQGD